MMRGDYLIVVVRVEIALRAAEGHRLLNAHHDGIGEATYQHHNAEDHVHDADALVVDAGEPLAPQIAPEPVAADGADDQQPAQHDHCERRDQDRLMNWDCIPGEPAEDECDQVEMFEHRMCSGAGGRARRQARVDLGATEGRKRRAWQASALKRRPFSRS